jgi:RES domain-containing protein
VTKHLPRRRLSQHVWHQTRPSNALLQFEDPADYEGRYHRVGGSGAWYASLTERGAWAELFRHWSQHEISPFEVRRRVGRARVTSLVVLDLTDPAIRSQLGVTEEGLAQGDWTTCQALADQARSPGFEGILARSGALAGERTLVVFPDGMAKVIAEHSRVQRPPHPDAKSARTYPRPGGRHRHGRAAL